jgi:hypothetical protein
LTIIGAINNINYKYNKEQDRDRNLGTLERTPTSLMEYPKFGVLDSQWEEKMIRALKTNRVLAVGPGRQDP